MLYRWIPEGWKKQNQTNKKKQKTKNKKKRRKQKRKRKEKEKKKKWDFVFLWIFNERQNDWRSVFLFGFFYNLNRKKFSVKVTKKENAKKKQKKNK